MKNFIKLTNAIQKNHIIINIDDISSIEDVSIFEGNGNSLVELKSGKKLVVLEKVNVITKMIKKNRRSSLKGKEHVK